MLDQQTLNAIIVAIGSISLGAVLGGGTVFVVYGKAIKDVLNSPLLMQSFTQLAQSWPAPVREAVNETGKFLDDIIPDEKPAA